MGVTESIPLKYHHEEHGESLKLARNEVYEGTYKGKKCVYKYTANSNVEGEILAHLQKNVKNIPELYYYNNGCYMSPSGKLFSSLIIMEKIEGISLYDFQISGKEGLTDILKELVKIVKQVHDSNVIYGDIFSLNVIITENNKPILLDFDYSYFKNKTCPTSPSIFTFHYWKQDTPDIFRLISLLEEVGYTFPKDFDLTCDINHLISIVK